MYLHEFTYKSNTGYPVFLAFEPGRVMYEYLRRRQVTLGCGCRAGMPISFFDFMQSAYYVAQNCATGLTAEGKTPKSLVEEMVPLLDSRDVMYASPSVIMCATNHFHPETQTKFV